MRAPQPGCIVVSLCIYHTGTALGHITVFLFISGWIGTRVCVFLSETEGIQVSGGPLMTQARNPSDKWLRACVCWFVCNVCVCVRAHVCLRTHVCVCVCVGPAMWDSSSFSLTAVVCHRPAVIRPPSHTEK